jgi:signal transduction histidine kinase
MSTVLGAVRSEARIRVPVMTRRVLAALSALVALEAVAALALRAAYTTVSPAVMVASVAVGVAFAGAGLVGWERRPANWQGPAMVAIGVLWNAGRLQGTAPLGLVLAAVVPTALVDALIVYALLSAPEGRLRSRLDRALVGMSLAIGIRDLPDVSGPGVADGLGGAVGASLVTVLDVVAILAIALVIGRVVARWSSTSPAARRPMTPVYFAASVLGLRAIASQVAVAAGAVDSGSDVLKFAELLSFGLIPLSLLVALLRAHLARTAVADLVLELGHAPDPAAVQDALRHALRDPTLEVHRWSADTGTFVDAHGLAVDPGAHAASQAATRLERGGAPLATIVHDVALLDEPDLLASVATAMRLGVDNERLQAEVTRQLAEVRESRVRIVEAGDAERKRVERDLHDGAQQRLVSLSLALRLIRSRLGPDADPALAAEVDAAAGQLRGAIAELRELARGIHPTVLTEAGLGAALLALAERSPTPVIVSAIPDERFPPIIEATAYFVAAEALTNVAKYAAAATVRLDVTAVSGCLTIEVRDDGVGGADPRQGSGLSGLADRVQALGGTFELTSRPGAGTLIRATLPADPLGAVSG